MACTVSTVIKEQRVKQTPPTRPSPTVERAEPMVHRGSTQSTHRRLPLCPKSLTTHYKIQCIP